MKEKERNKRKISVVTVNKDLDKLDDMILFPEKVERAKKAIARLGLPKEYRH